MIAVIFLAFLPAMQLSLRTLTYARVVGYKNYFALTLITMGWAILVLSVFFGVMAASLALTGHL